MSVDLTVVDVTNPVSPTTRSRVTLDYCGSERVVAVLAPAYVSVEGQYAYITLSMCALKVYDVSDSAEPELVGEADLFDVPLMSPPLIDSGDAFVSRTSGVVVVDVSDPTAPEVRDELAWAGTGNPYTYAATPVLVGDRLFVASYGDVMVVDVSDRDHLRLLGKLTTPGRALDVAVGEEILVADRRGGLLLLDAEAKVEPLEPTPTPTTSPTPQGPLASPTPVSCPAGCVYLPYAATGRR
jgi:hypothetical protein